MYYVGNHNGCAEVTALRAKISEMRDVALVQEREVRERVRDEFSQLVHSLHSLVFEQRTQYDEFREQLMDTSLGSVNEVRADVEQRLSAIRQNFLTGNTSTQHCCHLYSYYLIYWPFTLQ